MMCWLFCEQYKALNLPYPQDKNKVKEQVNVEEKEAVGICYMLCLIIWLQFA